MASYKNAAEILPPELLAVLQQYVSGEQLYVPRPDERVRWGERSGTRAVLAQRNAAICARRLQGATMEELMAEFHLSHDSIRKILVSGKNRSNRCWC